MKPAATTASSKKTFKRTGAHIKGKRMLEEGETNWPENAPFHTPVFARTHEERRPWERKGGTTFYFVNDGIESAFTAGAGGRRHKDIRIAGGAEAMHQYLNKGWLDEIWIHLAPVLLGQGVRLFEGVDNSSFSIEIVEAIHSPHVTHVRYKVTNR